MSFLAVLLLAIFGIPLACVAFVFALIRLGIEGTPECNGNDGGRR